MNVLQKSAWKEAPLLMMIALGLLVLPVSNSAGQIPLYVAGAIWLVQLCRKKVTVNRSTWIFLGGWMAWILISLTFAVHPEMGIRKLSRFLIFPLTGAVTSSCLAGENFRARVIVLYSSLVLGVTFLGVYDLFRFPYEILQKGTEFQDVGNMTSPQFYLVGIMIWLGLITLDREKVHTIWWACLPFMMTGLLLHQKRGVWLASMATIGLWTVLTRKWKILVTMLVLAGLALCIPKVRERLNELTEVVQRTHGGRMVLWTQVAPRIFQEHPWGMGYNGSKYEDFREVLPDDIHLEVGLRHLHNNFLQIRLELGWQGVVWWALWIAVIFFKAFRRGPPEYSALRNAVAFAFLGLFLNGLVEYNFGDSEVLKVYLVFFGLIDGFQSVSLKKEYAGIQNQSCD